MSKLFAPALCSALSLGLCMPTSAVAADLWFVANVREVVIDTAPNLFDDLTLLSQPVGQFFIPGSPSLNVLEAHEASWELPTDQSSARLTFSATSFVGNHVTVVIQNDWPIDADSAAFAGLLGLGITAGTPVDTWSITGLSAGAYEADPDPNDGDDTQLVYNGVRFEFALLSEDTSLYPNLNYRALPLGALGNPNVGAFIVEQGDAQGNVVYSAYGHILSVTAVPEPSRFEMLALGLGALAIVSWLRRAPHAGRAVPRHLAA